MHKLSCIVCVELFVLNCLCCIVCVMRYIVPRMSVLPCASYVCSSADTRIAQLVKKDNRERDAKT